jgi:hypothetical protein
MYLGMCDYRRGMDWIIVFIVYFNTQLINTINYSVIVILDNSQITAR